MDFVAGCIGGAAGCLASHPLDTIKVRMQCCQAVSGSHSTLECFRHIVKTESLTGLYKGLASPLSTVAAINSLCFGCYGYILKRRTDPDSLQSHFIAGAGAGLAICPIMGPMELVKCKLQMQSQQSNTPKSYLHHTSLSQLPYRLRSHRHRFTGPLHCLRTVYRSEGYFGINRGMLGLIAREVPAIGTYFACYQWIQRLYKEEMGTTHCPLSVLFLAGGISGCISWACSYPADVIKSRLQCDGVYDPKRKRFHYKYTGYVDCLSKSVKTDGLSVLYRGLSSSMLRAFPNNGVCLMVVSICHSVYTRQSYTPEQIDYDTISLLESEGGGL